MRLETTMPGARATDRRYSVRTQDEDFPWPVTCYFLRDDEERWACVGFEVGPVITRDTDPDSVVEIDPALVARETLGKKLPWYIDLCRLTLEGQLHGQQAGGKLYSVSQRRRRIDHAFLAQIAEEYASEKAAGHHPVVTIARRHGVDVSAASRWVKRAVPEKDR